MPYVIHDQENNNINLIRNSVTKGCVLTNSHSIKTIAALHSSLLGMPLLRNLCILAVLTINQPYYFNVITLIAIQNVSNVIIA